MLGLIISLTLGTVGATGIGLGQEIPSDPNGPSAVSQPVEKRSAKPSSTFCTNQDGLFTDKLSQTYLVLGGITTLLLLPTLLPLGFGYRSWWMTRPVLRWLLIAVFGWALVLLVAILVPHLVLNGTLPREAMQFAYSAIQSDYVDCLDVPVSSKGVLWGWFGDRERVVVVQEGATWFGALTVTLAGIALYWGLFFLLRLRMGSPSWRSKVS